MAMFPKWAQIAMKHVRDIEVTTTHISKSPSNAWSCTVQVWMRFKRHSRSVDANIGVDDVMENSWKLSSSVERGTANTFTRKRAPPVGLESLSGEIHAVREQPRSAIAKCINLKS
jgi:hypothetical protein